MIILNLVKYLNGVCLYTCNIFVLRFKYIQEIIQIAQSCNINVIFVEDTIVERSPSLQGFQDNFLDSWSSQSSLTGGSKNSGLDKMDGSLKKWV